MTTPTAPPLVPGQRLTREEFLRRWEQMPDLKNAELIAGIVYIPSPVSPIDSKYHFLVNGWLAPYVANTPGCEGGSTGTWLMLQDAPQPDVYVRILPDCGGQSRDFARYPSGAPELIVEVTVSTTSHDLGAKLELYRSAGVREYVSVLPEKPQVIWRVLEAGQYVTINPDADGILRSRVFPGLWLDPAALLAQDGKRVLEIVHQGLRSPDHQQFVDLLKSREERR